MSKLVAIVGDSGTGKSTGIKTLNPKETYTINVSGKELPFRGRDKLYNTVNKNYKELEVSKDILALLKTLSEKAPEIKNIVIEDANYIMGFNLVNKATETGYTKFSIMAKDAVDLIQGAKKLRDDIVVFYMSHSEEVKDVDEIVGYKMRTCGKMVDSQIKMEGLFTVILYTFVENKNDKAEFSFITNHFKKLPAKSPQGMFDTVKIPNDLQLVTDKVREYYS